MTSYPVPQAIGRDDDDGTPWKVEQAGEAGARTLLGERLMEVPLGDDEVSQGIRVHEMLHARYSPDLGEKGMNIFTLAAEDARIETLAGHHIERDYGLKPGGAIGMLRKGDLATAYLYTVAGINGPTWEGERKALAAEAGRGDLFAGPLLEFADWVASVYAEDTTFEATKQVAAALEEVITMPPRRPENGEGDAEGDGDGDQEGDGEGDSDAGDQGVKPGKPRQRKPPKPEPLPAGTPEPRQPRLAHGRALPKAAPPPKRYRVAPPRQPRHSDEIPDMVIPVSTEELATSVPMVGMKDPDWAKDNRLDYHRRWAPMAIEAPNRTVVLARKAGARRGRASDYGVSPKHLYRATIDQKVFASRRHMPQGTVVVDMSGSMSLSASTIEELIRKAPAAVVAGYWGVGGHGTLRILAAGGRMVSKSKLRPVGHANEVDGPAVEWLARQRGPRVLVSDERFTFIMDTPADGPPLAALHDTLRRARIVLVGHPDEAVRHLR